MTYSRYGGIGSVAQNIATSGNKEYHDGCTSGKYLCHKTNLKEEIDTAEYETMYEEMNAVIMVTVTTY